MSSRRESQGQALAALGGAGLIASLWLPWYTFHIPQAALDSVSRMSSQLGSLGPLLKSGAQLLNQLGPFHLTSWQGLHATPIVLLVVGIIAGGLSALALSDRAGNTAQLTMLGGAVATVLVGYRIVVPPGDSSLVHPMWGIYAALISAVLMLAGGGLSASDSGERVPAVDFPGHDFASQAPSSASWPIASTPSSSVAAATPLPEANWPMTQSVPPPTL